MENYQERRKEEAGKYFRRIRRIMMEDNINSEVPRALGYIATPSNRKSRWKYL